MDMLAKNVLIEDSLTERNFQSSTESFFQMSQLPERTIIEKTGHYFIPRDIVRQIVDVSNVPVYGL